MENKHRQEYIENEWYHVRYSGEIPEIALNSSLYFLTQDPGGPLLHLAEQEITGLRQAAAARFYEIILRDITLENRETTAYRGVLRSIANWRRYKRFCERHHLDFSAITPEICRQLGLFLEREVAEVKNDDRQTSINCTYEELNCFAIELDCQLHHLTRDLMEICPLI